MKINIKATTATELCQIRNSEQEDKIDVIKPMTQKVIVTNSKGKKTELVTPFYSGNSFRGKLRRASLQILIEKAIERNIPLPDATNFHLMNAGGGNNFQSQTFEVEQQVRELNPIISLFGTSLAVAGKLVTPNLMPYKYVDNENKEYYMGETDEGKVFSTIMTNRYTRDQFIKSDDLISKKGNALYLPAEVIEQWEKEVSSSQKERAKAREDALAEKINKKAIQAFLQRDYVIRGADFYTALSPMPTYNITPVEYGMLVKALEKVVLEYLGSNTAKGFGRMEYTIEFDDGSEIVTAVDAYNAPKIIKKHYKEKTQQAVDAFHEWLDNNFSRETFTVSNIMKGNKA